MPGNLALSCPKNLSARSDPVSFCASDNKILELESLERPINSWKVSATSTVTFKLCGTCSLVELITCSLG